MLICVYTITNEVIMTRNERGAGRKPLPYLTKTMRVPVDLIPSFSAQIAQYKLDGDYNAKHDTSKATI